MNIFNIQPQSVKAFVGTAGTFVEGIGFLLEASTDDALTSTDKITVSSGQGIRLFETYNIENGEVRYFRNILKSLHLCLLVCTQMI